MISSRAKGKSHKRNALSRALFTSEFFPLERGVRRGCPLSGLLFVIGIEILARAIKNDVTIKGIKVGGKEIKVSLYADDTAVPLQVAWVLGR